MASGSEDPHRLLIYLSPPTETFALFNLVEKLHLNLKITP